MITAFLFPCLHYVRLIWWKWFRKYRIFSDLSPLLKTVRPKQREQRFLDFWCISFFFLADMPRQVSASQSNKTKSSHSEQLIPPDIVMKESSVHAQRGAYVIRWGLLPAVRAQSRVDWRFLKVEPAPPTRPAASTLSATDTPQQVVKGNEAENKEQ